MKARYIFFTLIALFIIGSTLSANEIVHVLQKGETLYSLSRKYNVSSDLIMELNKITNPEKLKIGQKIKIPQKTVEQNYKIQKGDTLFGIAKKFNISVQELMDSNSLKQNSIIKIGDSLKIPTKNIELKQTNIVKSTNEDKTNENKNTVTIEKQKVEEQKSIEDPRVYKTKTVDSNIIWPVTAKELSYLAGKLYGVSIISDKGEPVKNIATGTVISTGPYRGFGQVVFVQTQTGYIYVYGGLDGVKSKPGQLLNFGEQIGFLGSDLLSGKAQLYFMVYNKNAPIDPAKAPRG